MLHVLFGPYPEHLSKIGKHVLASDIIIITFLIDTEHLSCVSWASVDNVQNRPGAPKLLSMIARAQNWNR